MPLRVYVSMSTCVCAYAYMGVLAPTIKDTQIRGASRPPAHCFFCVMSSINRTCVCVYVCMCLGEYVCARLWVHMCVRTWVYVCIGEGADKGTHARPRAVTDKNVQPKAHTRGQGPLETCLHACVYVCVRECVKASMRVCEYG